MEKSMLDIQSGLSLEVLLPFFLTPPICCEYCFCGSFPQRLAQAKNPYDGIGQEGYDLHEGCVADYGWSEFHY
jgi:hypothetical protein